MHPPDYGSARPQHTVIGACGTQWGYAVVPEHPHTPRGIWVGLMHHQTAHTDHPRHISVDSDPHSHARATCRTPRRAWLTDPIRVIWTCLRVLAVAWVLSRVVVLTRIRMLFTLPSIGLLPPLRPPAWAIASCSAVPAGESDLLFMPLTGLGPDVLMDFPLLITESRLAGRASLAVPHSSELGEKFRLNLRRVSK